MSEDDLVDRLRSAARWRLGHPEDGGTMPTPDLLDEAADEIERLRKMVSYASDIGAWDGDPNFLVHMLNKMKAEALDG